MRIGVNALFLIPGKVGGTETYLHNLLRNLAMIDRENEYIIFTNKENSGIFEISQGNFKEALCPIKATFRPARIFWEQFILPLQVSKYNIDVLYSAGYTAPVIIPCSSVVTIHDMNYFYYPEDFSRLSALFLKVLVPIAAKRVDKIITVSNNSKKDIVKILKVPESKVCVTYEAGKIVSLPEEKVRGKKLEKDYRNDKKFILTVSASHPHKNLPRLVEAYNILYKKYQIKHQLIMVGIKGRAHHLLTKSIKKLSLGERVKFIGWVSREDLSLLYLNADLFVFPSLFEGFGLPILEAMSCGVPVITSNYGAMAEVAGEAALLVDPYNIDEIAEAMYKVLTDKNLRENLIKKGLERAKQFSWEKTAKETLKIYKEVAHI